MSRRSTPARLAAARRAATINRPIGEGELPTRAEAKVAASEARTDAGQGIDTHVRMTHPRSA